MNSFLSRDLQHLSAAPALLQVAAASHASSEARSMSESLAAEMAQATSEEDSAGEPLETQDAVDAPQQPPAASVLQENSAAQGPFDKVSEMLQALISALREEANDDAAGEDMRKWCLGAVKVNKKAEVLAQGTIDMLKTE